MKIQRALISVSDKTNLIELGTFLSKQNVEIVSTGGSAKLLRQNDIPVTDIETVTGFPEILDGRVKTLHPMVHGGILARRDQQSQLETLDRFCIQPIDLVVVNLYPFEKVSRDASSTENDLIENIDIGGVTLLRAAAKNYKDVLVLSDPGDYEVYILKTQTMNSIDENFRRNLALKAFRHTSQYDLAILDSLSDKNPEANDLALRYGENPHQSAKVIPAPREGEIPLATTKPLQGKKLSYNNLLDADSALFSLRCLVDGTSKDTVGAVVVKHNNLCGAAQSQEAFVSLKTALASDSTSAFGGIVALSHPVDAATADLLASIFLEVVLAPNFSNEAKSILSKKVNLRLLKIPNLVLGSLPLKNYRNINGGLLVQDHEMPFTNFESLEVVTTRKPSNTEWKDLELAFRTVMPCKSNAITLTKNDQLLAAASGQTSRVDAVMLAIQKAKKHKHPVQNSVLGSDAFFPFKDSIEIAAKSGISAIIQPGGSKKDKEVIDEANKHNITMVFTQHRCFRH